MNILRKISIRQALLASMVFWLVFGTVLALFRNAKQDETYYIQEAWVIADCLRNGEWIGDQAVGWHGTLFKIPAALIMVVTGPSVFAATFTTVIITVASFWLCHRVFRQVLKNEWWALVGAWLTISNYLVLWGLPRFGRDIPAMFAVLLLLETMVYKRGRWTIGLVMLVLLEARECVFFACLPAFLLWVAMDCWIKEGKHGLKSIARVAGARYVAGLFPAIVWMVLMLCTNVVPVNMHAANILGVTGGYEYQAKHFRPEVAARNVRNEKDSIYQIAAGNSVRARMKELGPFAGQMPVRIKLIALNVAAWSIDMANLILLYMGKLLYPYTFSFVGIPKVLAIPAVIMSVRLGIEWRRNGKGNLLGMLMIFWCYLAIWFLRASFGRYLLPVFPVMALCYVAFLKDGVRDSRFALLTLLATTVLVGFGFCFDAKNFAFKLTLNIVAIVLTSLSCLSVWNHWRSSRKWRVVTILVLGFFSTAVAMYGSIIYYDGQVRKYITFGYNLEYADLVTEFDPEETVWLNKTKSHLIFLLYRRERPETAEQKWHLHPLVPKKYVLEEHQPGTYKFSWYELDDLREQVEEYGITTIVLMASECPRYKFPHQDDLDAMKNADWLRLERTITLKNKTVYVFKVRTTAGDAITDTQPD